MFVTTFKKIKANIFLNFSPEFCHFFFFIHIMPQFTYKHNKIETYIENSLLSLLTPNTWIEIAIKKNRD